MKNIDNLKYEKELWNKGYQFIAGIDEVGRGCIAGPVVVAAVILPINYVNKDITDSKLIKTHQKRKLISDAIKKDCIAYHIEFVNPEIVDEINVKQASRLGMQKCVEKIKQKPDYLLIDWEVIKTEIEFLNLKKGDLVSQSIGAASILAKVARDEYMYQIAKKYPQYSFENHVGYGTQKHLAAIAQHGVIEELHRKSCAPIKKYLEKK